jgi:hypothetical protein
MPDLPPTKKVEGQKEALLKSFGAGATWYEATRAVGISERTIRRWCDADPEFADAVAEARDRADSEVEFVTYRNCIDPDPAHNTLRTFWLKSRRPAVYGERADVNLSGTVKVLVEYADAAAAPRPSAPGPGRDPAGGAAV